MFKLVLGKREELEIKLPTSTGLSKKQKSSRKTSTSALLTMPKPPTVFRSVQFSRSVLSHSLRPHWTQHTRPPCPSPTARLYPNSCPLSQWCHPIISSSVIPIFSCLQSFPASGSFQMSQLFTSGGQSTGVSASTSVFPMNTQDWSPLVWTSWISLQSKGLSRVFSQSWKSLILRHSAFFIIQLSHPHTTTGGSPQTMENS